MEVLMEVLETIDQEDGSCLMTLDMTEYEASKLFLLGLEELVGDTYRVLPPGESSGSPNTVEISSELYSTVINVGFNKVLTDSIT